MILYFVPKCPKALIHYVSLPRSGAADRGTPVHCKNTFVFNSLHYSTWQTLCKAALYQILSAPNYGKALKSAQQMTAGPVKARTFPAGNVSLRFKAAPSRGNQFPLDTRLRRDTPAAGKTTDAGTPLTPADGTRPSKGADISCGKCVASLQRRAFQGEPVPPGYAPAARYPLRSPRGTETDRHVGRGLAPAVGTTTVPEPRLPQQMARNPVKARTFPAGNVSLRSKAAPSRGNQFPLDTRLRRDTPSALRGGPKPTVT